MNGTLFFDTLSTQDTHQAPFYTIGKNNRTGLHLINHSMTKVELGKELFTVPINILSTTCPSMSPKSDENESNCKDSCLYRPISPIKKEPFTSYGCINSTNFENNGVKYNAQTSYSQVNNQQTYVIGKLCPISSTTNTTDIFTSSNNYQHSTGNIQYSFSDGSYENDSVNSNNNNEDIGNLNDHNYHHHGSYGHYNNNNNNKNRNNNNSNNSSQYSINSNNNNYNNNYHREHRRKPINSHYRQSGDIMVRRVYGLTHRLKSRSSIMKIDPHPDNLLNSGPYDQLSQAIWDVFTSKAQKIETYESKITLWKDIFLYIRKCLNHYALYIVGSTMTGFGLNSSDIDMCLLIKPCTEDPRLDSVHQLHHIKNHLLKYGLIIDSELILAKVPILKFRDQSTGYEIDLNCNNSVGIYNTHLLYCYARIDWRVRPLVVMVKIWAQANRINDAKNLTVSSYSWTLMVIHYLQCGVSPYVLPCLHTLFPDRFNADKSKITDIHEELKSLKNYESYNTLSLAELFIGFFGYYSNFDFTRYAVSVRIGGRLLIENCKQVKAPKNDQNQWRYMCIEEPFDFTNTARSVYDIAAFRHIKNIIIKTYEELSVTKMLSSVLPVTLRPEPSIT